MLIGSLDFNQINIEGKETRAFIYGFRRLHWEIEPEIILKTENDRLTTEKLFGSHGKEIGKAILKAYREFGTEPNSWEPNQFVILENSPENLLILRASFDKAIVHDHQLDLEERSIENVGNIYSRNTVCREAITTIDSYFVNSNILLKQMSILSTKLGFELPVITQP